MFFDPFSTWLVFLLAYVVIVANEKWGSRSALGKWEQECIMQNNRDLNDAIRCVKESVGYSEEAYEKIRCHIGFAANRYPSNGSRQYIVIDLDNQEYIIGLLEKSAKMYGEQTDESSQRKAEVYRSVVIEAKKRYEEQCIEEKKQEKIN